MWSLNANIPSINFIRILLAGNSKSCRLAERDKSLNWAALLHDSKLSNLNFQTWFCEFIEHIVFLTILIFSRRASNRGNMVKHAGRWTAATNNFGICHPNSTKVKACLLKSRSTIPPKHQLCTTFK